MPKRVQRPIDAENFFQKGESFYYTGRFLGRQPEEVFAPAGFAMVTCYAFACEVYLKVLAHLEHGLQPLETHDLRFLFEDLKAETQALIAEKWTVEYLPGIRRGIGAAPMPRAVIRPQSFRQALENSSKAFVDWRYETGNGKPLYFHMIGLPAVVRPMILQLRPKFQRRYRHTGSYPLDPPTPPVDTSP